MTPVFVNGKFFAQSMTGVQRYARSLLAAVDARFAVDRPSAPWTVLVPRGVQTPTFAAMAVRAVAWHGPGGLHGWEQFALPWAARTGRLVNLAGSAPAFAPRQACVMHDAAVFDWPQAYSKAFRTWYRWLFRRLAVRRATLITISEFSRQRLATALRVPPDRFAIVPGGADHLSTVSGDERALARHGLADRRFLLAVASMNPTKNLAMLVRAWAALAREDAALVVAGGGNARVFATSDLPRAANVLMLGSVDDAALVALYRQAAGLVFPSLYEGFGLPPLEAMAGGCPVAASRAASLPEVCADAALMFDPLDPAAMADAMRRILDDAALAATLRERGRRRAAELTWDRSAAALLRALEAAA